MRFGRPLAPRHGDAAGLRLLAAFVVVGIGLPVALRLALGAAGLRGSGAGNMAFVFAWLLAFVVAHRRFVRLPGAAVGLRRYAEWTVRERLYFSQVVPLVAVAFALLFRAHLQALLDRHGLAGFALFSILTGIAWGVAQELFYRGWLQTELTRRWGSLAGLLAANAAYAFGPLHFDYYGGPEGVRWAGLAAIFAIGLLFGFLYSRSGNLWLPAVMHGLWPLNMA